MNRARGLLVKTFLKIFVVQGMLVIGCGSDENTSTKECYLVGVGKADITGRWAGGRVMNGYANPFQIANGLQMRLWARTLIVKLAEAYSPGGCDCGMIVYVVVDLAMLDAHIHSNVLQRLEKKYPGNIFTEKNVMISATHNHNGPGGYMNCTLYILATAGYHGDTACAIIDGIFRSIVMAYEDLKPGRIKVGNGTLDDANINRSPSAYLNNPSGERATYDNQGGNRCTNMTAIRIEQFNETPNDCTTIGCFNWFAVHATSMNYSNKLVTGDNKGYASQYCEMKMGGKFGNPNFVCTTSSRTPGDQSPNLDGAKCEGTDKGCAYDGSVCSVAGLLNISNTCRGSGPGKTMEESTQIIGTRQAEKGMEICEEAKKKLGGPMRCIRRNLDMRDYMVDLEFENGTTCQVKTCPPALGVSFPGGTTDGAGYFPFQQSETTGNPLWDAVSLVMTAPTFEQYECHKPKPVLLDFTKFPDWVTYIAPLQMFQIGTLIIVGIPGELTCMAGRRVIARLQSIFGPDYYITIAGLANQYTHYITTFEEYQVQRYEGASTLYGPHTLNAYIQELSSMAHDMMKDKCQTIGLVPPPTLPEKCGLPGIYFDVVCPFLGDCTIQPTATSLKGTVVVQFNAANPNYAPLSQSYLFVDKKDDITENWSAIADDNDFSTKLLWIPLNLPLCSVVNITWEIPVSIKPVNPGTYRIRHEGCFVNLFGPPMPYAGVTDSFVVS